VQHATNIVDGVYREADFPEEDDETEASAR
jgi:hypothetical protein